MLYTRRRAEASIAASGLPAVIVRLPSLYDIDAPNPRDICEIVLEACRVSGSVPEGLTFPMTDVRAAAAFLVGLARPEGVAIYNLIANTRITPQGDGLARLAPGLRRVGLSATVEDPPALAAYLGADTRLLFADPGPDPEISILRTQEPPPWAGQGGRYAAAAVMDLIRAARTTLVFINTRAQAELFFQALWAENDEGLPIGLHHGSLSREARGKVEAAMVAGELRGIVATGSLDLGIDWGDIDLVINVGAPKGASRLMQRIGRANHRYNAPSKARIVPANRFEQIECLAALAAGVMRKGAVCVTAPEQPKAVLSELVVAAAKAECELVVPDAEDITFLEAEKFTSKVDYGGYTAPLAFLGRHAAGSAAIAVELALALCKKGYDIPDEAILEGLAAVENRSSIRVLSQRPLVVLDACRTPQQAIALLRVLNMAKVRHLSAVIGLAEEEGAEAFFSALESGLTAETQKKDRTTMPGMSENPFDKVFLVPPAGTDAAMTERLLEKARYHFDAELCGSLAEAVELARANSRRGLLICGGEAIALEAADLLAEK